MVLVIIWACNSEKAARIILSWLMSSGFVLGTWDLVTRLIMGIVGVTIWVIRVVNLLAKSP